MRPVVLMAVSLLPAAAIAYDDRTTQHGTVLPPLPDTRPPAKRPPGTPAPPPEEPPPPVPAGPGSLDAAGVTRAIAAFRKAVPAPIEIVQLVIFPNDIAVLSTDGPGGGTVEYSYRGGEIGPPERMDTTYLDCKKGMPASAIDLEALARMVEDAPRHARIPGGIVLQIVVAQYPCGTAFINVPVEKPAFKEGEVRAVGVQYRGDGSFVKLN